MPGSAAPPRPTAGRGTALGLAVAVALLAGCSGDEPGTTAGGTAATVAEESHTDHATGSDDTASGVPAPNPPTPAATGDAGPAAGEAIREVTVTGVDFGYELAEDTLPAGEYTLTFVNEGDASHDLVVERDGEDVAATDVLRPGGSATLTVTLEPGEYVFYCSVGNHRAMGMEIPVTVTS